MIDGSCLCGATRFHLRGELTSARYCHCENCRKFSGTSPAAWAMANSSDLEVRSASTTKYNSGRGIRTFCRQCGSPVWFESIEFPEIIGIPLGVLEGEAIPAPEVHLWVSSNPAWCVIEDGLPAYETIPPGMDVS